ncbi:DUF4153 domain-containing protein [Ferviditalea candida]|uniref:DUF4153 domain-containing protein n=1 Tax=Ferviditalea candida TaxID=3108399 RepID=A0ABU5ZDY6_9BACL|nr:DUF4153 domain-containing protein [Paenibacillaceae bacterium T2]
MLTNKSINLSSKSLWVILLSIYLFGYIWSLLHAESIAGHETDAAGELQKGHKSAPRWDPVTVSTVLAIINLLYLGFAVIQFSYFFGGGPGSLPDGLTYNVEMLTAQFDIARYEQTGKFDARYLATLSPDAYPAIRRLTGLNPPPGGNTMGIGPI